MIMDLPDQKLPEHPVFHPVIRFLARVVSVVFHPLFIPVYLSWFLIYVYQIFPAYGAGERNLLLLRFFVMYSLFPLVTILLAKGLGFVQTITLKNPKDRIIPYVGCGLYYFWMWYVLRNQQMPEELVMLALAIFIASSLGLMANSYFKVSMHAMAVGVAVTFVLLLSFMTSLNFGPYIALALLVTGAVCTARMINSDHTPLEIYAGIFIGVLAQLVAYWV